jgi:NAD(P)-dependent dehydrogenase (short-subunit alcohol dehydrogenase family)
MRSPSAPIRSVLITGTSTGFGLVTAVELAKRGWRVFATMRNLEKRGLLDQALKAADADGNVDLGELDVTSSASINAAVERTLAKTGGRLDSVVHNAGVAAGGAFEDLPDSELRRVMETNFFGVLELTRALLPTFRAQRSGRIVVVSSESAFAGQPANSIYCASKWAVEGWAESIAFEVSPYGIDVSLIEPGPYVTAIWDSSPRISPDASPYRNWVQYMFRAGDAHVAARGRDPQEVAVKIAEVLEARRAPFRVPVGAIAHISHFLRGKIPTVLWRKGVERYLGLHRVRS